jgi:hypothetical protein
LSEDTEKVTVAIWPAEPDDQGVPKAREHLPAQLPCS